MKRFKVGDLAITHGLRDGTNNDRIVQIVAVVGSVPEWNLGFAYRVRLLDNLYFTIRSRTHDLPVVKVGALVQADHSNLRRLADHYAPVKQATEEV